jgi:hypothetical protein
MTALAASDVTVTLVQRRRVDGRTRNLVKLVFGNSTLTYPAGGIPITKGKLGCPNVLESLSIHNEGSTGYHFTYDRVNEKILIFQSPARTHTHDILLKDGTQADGATTRVNAAANKLGANSGGDLTITGGGANGGVVSTTLAAAALVEATGVAIAAQTIEAEVIGW